MHPVKQWTIISVEEYHPDTMKVAGSIPASSTKIIYPVRQLVWPIVLQTIERGAKPLQGTKHNAHVSLW